MLMRICSDCPGGSIPCTSQRSRNRRSCAWICKLDTLDYILTIPAHKPDRRKRDRAEWAAIKPPAPPSHLSKSSCPKPFERPSTHFRSHFFGLRTSYCVYSTWTWWSTSQGYRSDRYTHTLMYLFVVFVLATLNTVAIVRQSVSLLSPSIFSLGF